MSSHKKPTATDYPQGMPLKDLAGANWAQIQRAFFGTKPYLRGRRPTSAEIMEDLLNAGRKEGS